MTLISSTFVGLAIYCDILMEAMNVIPNYCHNCRTNGIVVRHIVTQSDCNQKDSHDILLVVEVVHVMVVQNMASLVAPYPLWNHDHDHLLHHHHHHALFHGTTPLSRVTHRPSFHQAIGQRYQHP